ncbi:MAG: hypothetical protein ACREO2_04220 [Arenimonas sp.]
MVCSLAAIFRVGDPRSLWSIVLFDAIFITLVAYPFVLAAIVVYATPLLWVALRYGFANPITSLAVALFPGLLPLRDGTSELMNWIPLAICTGIALVFIIHAYRPSNAFKESVE